MNVHRKGKCVVIMAVIIIIHINLLPCDEIDPNNAILRLFLQNKQLTNNQSPFFLIYNHQEKKNDKCITANCRKRKFFYRTGSWHNFQIITQ